MAYTRPTNKPASAPSTPAAAPVADAPAPTATPAAAAPETWVKKPQKPNPFRMEHFTGEFKSVQLVRKANKDATDLEKVAQLQVVDSTGGKWLSSGRDPATDRYSVSAKREIAATGSVAKTPIAYISLKRAGSADAKGEVICSLFKQQSQKGDVYLKGTVKETGEVYLLFVDRRPADGESK